MSIRSLVFASVAAGASAFAQPGVEYVVDLHGAASQTVDVTMHLRRWDKPHLEVHLPVWRPGRYEVLDPAGAVTDVRAAGQHGPLGIEKTGKATWRIDTSGTPEVAVSYRLYANELGSRTRHADETHAFLSGAATFLYCHERRGDPVRVVLSGPEGWIVATGLEQEGDDPRVLIAPDYDVLVDSPIEFGEHERTEFEARGVRFQVAVWGDAGAIPAKFHSDLKEICSAQTDLFGGFPARRYVFITHVSPGAGGGTEHLNSTVIQARPAVATDPKVYRGLLALASHELFHTWNVKQFRPDGIKPYDYQRENYTKLLWVAEGTTSYYDELLCVRAGVVDAKHYLESLAKAIDAEVRRPGGAVQSLEDSSFDAWIKFNRPSPNSVNTTVSFYSKGALVNLMLDVEIRRRTSNARSLDDVMRELYRRFPLDGPAYSSEDLLAILQDTAGGPFAEFFARFVRGTDPLPIAEYLAPLGLELHREPPEGGPTLAPYTGLDLKDQDGLAVVSAVRADGPAHAAGFIVDDQIVAIDGRRTRAADLDARLRGKHAGDVVTVTLFRRDHMITRSLTLADRPNGDLKIRRVKEPTPQQKAMYESWIGAAWPE